MSGKCPLVVLLLVWGHVISGGGQAYGEQSLLPPADPFQDVRLNASLCSYAPQLLSITFGEPAEIPFAAPPATPAADAGMFLASLTSPARDAAPSGPVLTAASDVAASGVTPPIAAPEPTSLLLFGLGLALLAWKLAKPRHSP